MDMAMVEMKSSVARVTTNFKDLDEGLVHNRYAYTDKAMKRMEAGNKDTEMRIVGVRGPDIETCSNMVYT